MEGLKVRAYTLAAGFGLWGLVILATPALHYAPKTEAWMEDHSPINFNGWMMRPGDAGSKVTYRMDAQTYDWLHPYGIVARIYDKGPQSYDVVLIASAQRQSFHDPRLCFTAQGWNLKNDKSAKVTTETRGTIPVSVVTVQKNDGDPNNAVFFYRGPKGFYSTTANLKWAMFWERFRGGNDVDGVFYRFIPLYPNAKTEDTFKFASEFLAAAQKTSNGYF